MDDVTGDARFDGKHIYAFMNKTSVAVYAIRGKYIYKAHTAGPPVYEIGGDNIYAVGSDTKPSFEICGVKIRKAKSTSDLYEIR